MNDDFTDNPRHLELRRIIYEIVPDIIHEFAGKDVIPGWYLLKHVELVNEKVGSYVIPSMTSEQAAALVELAANDAGAFDLACYASGMNLAAEVHSAEFRLPSEFREFAAMVLTGEAKRPAARGRPRQDPMLKAWQYSLCKMVVHLGPMQLQRGKESGSERFSACDVVAEAFTKAGFPTTHDQLSELCNAKGYADIRAFAERLGMLDFSDLDA